MGLFDRLFGRRGSYNVNESGNGSTVDKSIINARHQKGWWARLKGWSRQLIGLKPVNDLPSRKSIRARLDHIHNAFPYVERFKFDENKADMTDIEMIDIYRTLHRLYNDIEFDLDHHEDTYWFKAIEELNLYCLLQSLNIFDHAGVKRPVFKSTKELVKRVLGTLPHGMKREFYDQFLVTVSDYFEPNFRLINSTFWATVQNLSPRDCENLDEVVYSKDRYKDLANEVLRTSLNLNYSPDLLRICLELLEAEDSMSMMEKRGREKLVAAIQDSIKRVPNMPCKTRVDRQINDLRLIIELKYQKLPNSLVKSLDLLSQDSFNGSDEAIAAVLDFIKNHRDEFRDSESAARTSYIRLVEELNLYCLSNNKIVDWDPKLKRRKLSQKWVVDVLGNKLPLIEPERLKQYLLTAGLSGSNRFLIKRVLGQILTATVSESNDSKPATITTQNPSSFDQNSTLGNEPPSLLEYSETKSKKEIINLLNQILSKGKRNGKIG